MKTRRKCDYCGRFGLLKPVEKIGGVVLRGCINAEACDKRSRRQEEAK